MGPLCWCYCSIAWGRVPRACIQLILVGAVLTLLALYQSLETLTFIPQKRMHVNGSAARIPLVAAWVRPCRPCWMVCDMMCCALRERDSLAIVRLVLFVTGVADCMHSVLHLGRCGLVARAASQQQPHTGAGIRQCCMGADGFRLREA